MRKSLALKTLLRSPLKTLLTFLLIAAASFALFSRITDYAIVSRESAKAESFYYGVAALNNSTPPMGGYYPDPKPWPTEEQIEEFTSLPGITLVDTRYMTDGLVEDYKRVIDPDASSSREFVVEGTYEGYDEYGEEPNIRRYLKFNDVTVHAGEINLDPRMPMKITVNFSEEIIDYYQQPFSRSSFDELEQGSRYLVVGGYSVRTGTAFELDLYDYTVQQCICPIDGLGDDYLETEEFSWYKGEIAAIKQSKMTYDIVYTSDMRAIPYVNERKIVVSEGRPLTVGDTDACVVSEFFLETHGLSIGDKLHIKLGDRLLSGMQGMTSTRTRSAQEMSNFPTSVELEIIGAYRFTNEWVERTMDNSWSYGVAAVFVPSSLLPVEVPKDHETQMGDFSVFIEDPHDIQAFRAAAESVAAEMGLSLRFSDGGWAGMKDSFKTGSLASFLTTVLYVLGAALALLLAVYLYIGRNKKSYAIMRTLGVPSKKAGRASALPFAVLSIFAVLAGGMSGLLYASYTAAKTLAGISGSSAPDGYVYVLNAAIPIGVVMLCFVLELLFIFLVMFLFQQKMKKTSPLELLQEDVGVTKKTGILRNPYVTAKHGQDIADTASVPDGLDIARITAVNESPVHGKYSALRQVSTYTLRHMQRGFGKTAVSFVLAVVLAAGIGTFVLAKSAYQDICREMEVKGRAMEFSSSNIMELSKSSLVKDIYYYSNSSVRVNGVGVLSPITFTNDFEQYLACDYTVAYAKGYDASIFEGTGTVCLVGQTLAQNLGIRPGDDITLMSESLYSFMPQVYEAEELEDAIERAGIMFKVAGILKSGDEDADAGVFAAANSGAEMLFSSFPFSIGYCEFTLADNTKIPEMDSLLEELQTGSIQYSPAAYYHIDSDLLDNTKRIRDLLVSLFPIAVAAAVLIGLFGPGLLILQSAQEAAFLRILGVTKKRARCMLLFEQVFLCIAGIALVAGVLVLFVPERFMGSTQMLAFCWLLYFLGSICGVLVASVQVTRHKLLELLQVKE